MEKIRRKLTREKIVVTIYQYLLTEITVEDAEVFLRHDKAINDPKFENGKEDEIAYCKDAFSSIVESIEEYCTLVGENLKSGWTINRLSKMEQAILITGCYELKAKNVEKTVVINEAVELAKKFCDDQSYKFINGVLNKL